MRRCSRVELCPRRRRHVLVLSVSLLLDRCRSACKSSSASRARQPVDGRRDWCRRGRHCAGLGSGHDRRPRRRGSRRVRRPDSAEPHGGGRHDARPDPLASSEGSGGRHGPRSSRRTGHARLGPRRPAADDGRVAAGVVFLGGICQRGGHTGRGARSTDHGRPGLASRPDGRLSEPCLHPLRRRCGSLRQRPFGRYPG